VVVVALLVATGGSRRRRRARLVAAAAMAGHAREMERERRGRLEHGSELAGSGGFESEDKHRGRKRR